jgi:hypothetical protein
MTTRANERLQNLDVDHRCESCVRSDRLKSQPLQLLLRHRKTLYFERLGADEHEPIRDVRVHARHVASPVSQLTPLAACIVALVPDSE